MFIRDLMISATLHEVKGTISFTPVVCEERPNDTPKSILRIRYQIVYMNYLPW